MIFFDTESVGKTGALVLIQFCELDIPDKIILHKVWDEPIKGTLHLIEQFCNVDCIVGFNLTHDWFMLTKWYNIFRQAVDHERPPIVSEIRRIESIGPTPGDVCLKPNQACDLMLIARQGKYQYLAKHKPVTIRKVPVQAIPTVIDSLGEIILPDGVSCRWRISEKRSYERKDVKDIVGEFKGLSTSLKYLASIILKDPKIAEGDFESEVGYIPFCEAPEYRPWGSDWSLGLQYLSRSFQDNRRAIAYATNDICYTFNLWCALGRPEGGDDDSELACLIGASYWKGFHVADKEILLGKIRECKKDLIDVPTAPVAVMRYVGDFLSPLERSILKDTKKVTLEEIERWEGHPASDAVKKVIKARKAQKRIDILQKLIAARCRFNFSMKIIGTLCSRMSGGTGEKGEAGRKLNPQGIPSEKAIRELFLLAFEDEGLEGGDFSAFEPTILDAVVGDEQFRRDLQSNLKIHLFAGSEFYKSSPESINATKGTTDDRYKRTKNAFLGWIYGAQQKKIAQTLDLTEEQVEEGYQRISKRYPQIKIHRDVLFERFTPIVQIKGEGTAIEWREPDDFIESILGFKRYFTLEWSVIRGLFSLASQPPEEWKNLKGSIRRTNRVQTIPGACQSALYSAIFALQAHVFRAAANHEMQSPGAQITKQLQRKIWDLQPPGIGSWIVRPFNYHDEVLVCVAQSVSKPDEGHCVGTVTELVAHLRQQIQLLKIAWKSHLKNWGEKD